MNTTTTHAHEQAAAQLSSIVQMVAALSIDFDRLQELRDEYEAKDEEELRRWTDLGELQELETLAGGEHIESEDDAREAIQQDALSVEVRTDWHAPGADEDKPTEFCILLCTGGPAVRLIGTLNQHSEAETVRLEYQDWGTPWTQYHGTSTQDRAAMLTYCQQFYFGE